MKKPQVSPSAAQDGPLPSVPQPAVPPGSPAANNNGTSQLIRLSACMIRISFSQTLSCAHLLKPVKGLEHSSGRTA
jgi:hypothetical protein